MAIAHSTLRIMDWERRRKRKAPAEYRVMLFDPRGQYPRGTFHVPNGFFHADSEIVFSLVYGESWEQLDPDVPFSEFAWASPQELRLLASLVFCEKRDHSLLMLYPVVRFGPWLAVEDLDMDSPDAVDAVRSLLLSEAVPALRQSRPNQLGGSELQRWPNLVDAHDFSLNRLVGFWRSIDVNNYPLVRGAYALVKSDMLSRHYEFWEEAIISAYIAMEASFALILRRLRLEGCENPGARDAGRWLHRHFDEDFGIRRSEKFQKYFEQFYDERIMTLHPASRFGDLPYAPIVHDDLTLLRRSLREILSYLAIGSHSPDFHDARRSASRFIDE